MITERRLKILEYVTALLFLSLFAMLFYLADYYSAWAVILLFLLSLASIFLYADLRAKFYSRPPVIKEKKPLPDAPPQKSPEEIQREIKAARDLVAEICAAKNIELRFKREAQGGHYDLPEVWTIERAVPLDYEDLYKITASEYLTVQTRAHDDGLIYAEWFAVNIDRVVYEQD